MTRLGRSTALNMGAILCNVVVGLALSVALARIWGHDDRSFADYVYLSFFAGTLAMAVAAGLPALAVRLVAQARGAAETGKIRRLTATLVLWAIGGAALAALATLVVERTTGLLHLGRGAMVVVALAGLQAIHSVLSQAIQGAERFDLLLRRTLVTFPLAAVVAAVLALRGHGPATVLAAVAGGHLLFAVLLGRDLGRIPPGADSGGPTLAEVRPYFLVVTGILLLDLVVWQASELFFLRWIGSDTDIKLYHTAFRSAAAVVRMAPAALAGALVPAFASLAGRRAVDEIAPLYRRGVAAMAAITAAFALVGALLGPSLLGIYGPSFVAGYLPYLVLLAGFAAGNVSGVASTVFHGLGRADLLLRMGVVLVVANLLLDLLLIPSYGAAGAAVACAAAQALSVPIAAWLLRQSLGLSLPGPALARVAAASSIGLGFGLLVAWAIETAAAGWLDPNLAPLLRSLVGDLPAATAGLVSALATYAALGGLADLRPAVVVIDPAPPTDPPPPVSVIIPTKNRPQYLRQAAQRILADPGPPRELIVVDSSDDDRTANLVASEFPGARLVRVRNMPNNRHFAKNQGIRLARGSILCHLDDDSFIAPGWLEHVLDLYRDPLVGGTGGRIVDEVFGAAPSDSRIGQIEANGRIHLNFTRDPGQVVDVDHVIGCNMSFRAAALARAGGFDVHYGGPNFMEETDLCLRVRSAGYRIRWDPQAVVHHANAPRDTGMQRTSLDSRVLFWSARSRTYFMLKQLPRTVAVVRYNTLGFLKLHLYSAVRERSLGHLKALVLQCAGMSLGAIDWCRAGRPRTPLRLAHHQPQPTGPPG